MHKEIKIQKRAMIYGYCNLFSTPDTWQEIQELVSRSHTPADAGTVYGQTINKMAYDRAKSEMKMLEMLGVI